MDRNLEDWTRTDMARRAKQEDMKPFLFERSFDGFDTINRDDYSAEARAEAAEAEATESADEEPEEEVIEVVYSEEDLEKVKRQSYLDGHADGFREGHAEAMDTLEKQLNDLIEAIKTPLLTLQSEQARANDLAQANMARMMKELTAKLMPVYLRQYGAEEALEVISDCLSELQDAGRVTVHLSEETNDAIGERLKSVVQRIGFEGQLRLLIEEDYGPSDVRLDWGAGGAERRYETIKNEIDAAIDRAVDRAEAEIENSHAEQPPQESEQEAAESGMEVPDTIPDPMDATSTVPDAAHQPAAERPEIGQEPPPSEALHENHAEPRPEDAPGNENPGERDPQE